MPSETPTHPIIVEYCTDDLHQGAFLWCNGCEPEVTAAGMNRVHFRFANAEAQSLASEYISGRASVEPLRFSAAIRALKERAREALR